jgi:hypothetical protein
MYEIITCMCEISLNSLNYLLDFVIYSESNFIGRKMMRNRSRHPRFGMTLWKSFAKTDKSLPRTNNAVEAWHNAFHVMNLLTSFFT